jgi:uncharacterized membrane protein
MSYLKALQIGLIAGMRTLTAPALVSDRFTRNGGEALAETPLCCIGSREVDTLLKVLAIGELIADKTPWIPDRTTPPALIGRTLSGAFAGATLSAAEGERAEVGAVLGGIGAIASTYGMYHLRRRLKEQTNLPEPLLGLMEDLVAVGAGALIVKT